MLRKGLGSQVVAFIMVGGLGAVAFVTLSSLFVGMHAALPKWLVSTLCYGVLIGPVYLAHRRFSFRSEVPHGHALPRYVGVQLYALLLASVFSYVAYSVFGLPAFWASIIVTGLISAVNFVVLRLWAFAVGGAPAVLASAITIDSGATRPSRAGKSAFLGYGRT